MKFLKKHTRGALCILLSASILGGAMLYAFGTAADDYEETLLGELSKDFESGDPGAISSGNGDPGGKSYGAFQFASKSDGPKAFFTWCMDPSRNATYQSIGNQLSQAYHTEPVGYDSYFDDVWRAIAGSSYDAFLAAQRDYVEVSYYQQAVNDIAEAFPGFDIANYSIALRNVILSRAVQHGSGGVVSVMEYVMGKLGGFKNQPETELIQAIYEESGEIRDPDGRDGESCMEGATAEKYGVAGKVMSWFWGSSSDVQLGVYSRLRINEPAKAQNMLATYGYTDAPLPEGIYQLSPAGNSSLAALVQGSSLVLNTPGTDKSHQFRLTYYASGYYTITHTETALRLTAAADGTLSMSAPTADNNQMWKFARVNNGYSLMNRATQQYLSADSVSAGGTLMGGSEPVQWQVAKAGSAWTLTGAHFPTYANILQAGNSGFPFRGTLRCVDPIENVVVRILDTDWEYAIPPAHSGTVNARSYDLSDLDSSVAFSRLGAGSYTMVIEAYSSGETDNHYYFESKFFVSDGKYLLSFDACGGTASANSMQVSAGQAYGALPTAAKDGYIFVGWFTKPEGGTQITPNMITGAANQTLYAHYAKAFTYTFYNYDNSVYASGQLLSGDVIPAPQTNPTRPSDATHYYTFTGWEGYSNGMTIRDNVSFKATFSATAIDTLPEMVTEAYRISDGYLRKLAVGTPVSTLQGNLAPSQYITVSKGSAAVSDVAATGMTVEYKVDGTVLQTLTVVVTGDINGDGKYTITDLVQVQSHLLGRNTLSGAALQAADFSGDGKVTITDMVQATSAMLGRTAINPN